MSYQTPPAMHHNDSLMIDNGFAGVDTSNIQPMTQGEADFNAWLVKYDRQQQQALLQSPLEPPPEPIINRLVIDRDMLNSIVPLTDAEAIEGEALLAANNHTTLSPPAVDNQIVLPPPASDDQMTLASSSSNDQMTFPAPPAPMVLPGSLEPKNLVLDDKYRVKKPIGRRENSAAALKRKREKEIGPEPKPERAANRQGMRSGYRGALQHHKQRCCNPLEGCKPDCKLWVDFRGDHERLSFQRIPRPKSDAEVDLYGHLDKIGKRVKLWDHLAADYLAAS